MHASQVTKLQGEACPGFNTSLSLKICKFGTKRPPKFMGSCNFLSFCLGFLPCQIHFESAFSKSSLVFFVMYRGSIWGYSRRGGTFILMRLIRPIRDSGSLCHFYSEICEAANSPLKGKLYATSVKLRVPSGIASDLVKLIV